jgi:hypothetical protein
VVARGCCVLVHSVSRLIGVLVRVSYRCIHVGLVVQSLSAHAACVICLLIVTWTVSGCKWQSRNTTEIIEQAQRQALAGNMQWSTHRSGGFKLTVAARLAPNINRIHVYIEGDGRAWATRSRLSSDPTPDNAVALALAVKDPHPSVVYIARPCQYLDAGDLATCAPKYWSSHRFATEVLVAFNALLDEVTKAGVSMTPVRLGLVGYSGGGTLAAFLAIARSDVDWLVTVAANLDHQAWTAFHQVSPLQGSRSLVNEFSQLAKIRQCHLLGQYDEIVPPPLARAFLSKLRDISSPGLVSWKTIAEFDHGCCWPTLWPRALLPCAGH